MPYIPFLNPKDMVVAAVAVSWPPITPLVYAGGFSRVEIRGMLGDELLKSVGKGVPLSAGVLWRAMVIFP